jgi:hypothetical protein
MDFALIRAYIVSTIMNTKELLIKELAIGGGTGNSGISKGPHVAGPRWFASEGTTI